MEKAERCDNCRYSTPTNHEVPAVYCRYNPPTETHQNSFSQFPKLTPSNWCGRWESVVTEEVVAETKEWTGQ